jgi:anti-anti-sigma regulatory factor
MANAEGFGVTLKQALAADSNLVVDLGGLSFIDGAGLRAILGIAESRDGVGPLTLINASRVAWLLEAVGLDDTPSINLAGGNGHGG